MNGDAADLSNRLIRVETQMARIISDIESEKRTRANANRDIKDEIAEMREENNVRFDKVAEKQEENREAIIEGQRRTDRIIYLAMGAGFILELGLRFAGK